MGHPPAGHDHELLGVPRAELVAPRFPEGAEADAGWPAGALAAGRRGRGRPGTGPPARWPGAARARRVCAERRRRLEREGGQHALADEERRRGRVVAGAPRARRRDLRRRGRPRRSRRRPARCRARPAGAACRPAWRAGRPRTSAPPGRRSAGPGRRTRPRARTICVDAPAEGARDLGVDDPGPRPPAPAGRPTGTHEPAPATSR